jgi:hypothetical protein
MFWLKFSLNLITNTTKDTIRSLSLDHYHRKISEDDQRWQRKSFQDENDKILISYVLFLKRTKKMIGGLLKKYYLKSKFSFFSKNHRTKSFTRKWD